MGSLVIKVTSLIRQVTSLAGRHCAVTGFVCTLLLMYGLVIVEQTQPQPIPVLVNQHRVLDRDAYHVRQLSEHGIADILNHSVVIFDSDLIQKDTPSESPEATWSRRQEVRQTLIRQTCASHVSSHMSLDEALKTELTGTTIVVDEKHKVVYCAIAKAACSSWRSFLAALTGKVNTSDHSEMLKIHDHRFLASIGLKPLSYYGRREREAILESYDRLMVVRHPFERLVSAFRDKFQEHGKWAQYFQNKFGTYIISKYRRNANVKSRLTGYDVKFPEFVQWLNDKHVSPSFKFNPHWAKYQDVCHPCIINYNNIVAFETFEEDMDHVAKTLFHVNNTQEFFPHRNAKATGSSDVVDEFFDLIPEAATQSLKELYGTDFEMFNYTWPR